MESELSDLIEEGVFVSDHVELIGPLSRGAMGEVWRAQHHTLGVEVAVKFLGRSFLAHDGARERFRREAQAAARLQSPYVVRHFDHGELEVDSASARLPYIVMELLTGRPLDVYLEQNGSLDQDEALELAQQVGAALKEADRHGIVHRDLKTDNIFRCQHDELTVYKVLDFGIALLPETKRSGEPRLTRSGEVMGTPPYMSPEMFVAAEDAEHSDDLWSLSVVLYECLVGQVPFAGETPREISENVRRRRFATAATCDPELGAAVDAFFDRAFHPRLHRRFLFADELVESFAQATRPSGERAPESPTEATEADISREQEAEADDRGSTAPFNDVLSSKRPRRAWGPTSGVVVAALALVAGLVVLFRAPIVATVRGRSGLKDAPTTTAPRTENEGPEAAPAVDTTAAAGSPSSEDRDEAPSPIESSNRRAKALPKPSPLGANPAAEAVATANDGGSGGAPPRSGSEPAAGGGSSAKGHSGGGGRSGDAGVDEVLPEPAPSTTAPSDIYGVDPPAADAEPTEPGHSSTNEGSSDAPRDAGDVYAPSQPEAEPPSE